MSGETPALIVFLRARLDEDEAAAHEAASYEGAGNWFHTGDNYGNVGSANYLEVYLSGSPAGPHIARHDPNRVLAEVTAKRQMVSLVESAASRLGVYEEQTIGWDFLIAMAQIWRDHPEARPDGEWYEHEIEWR